MAQLIVKAKKLNKRRIIPTFLPDPDNIVGVVKQDFIFEGEQVPTSELPNPGLGTWYKDRDAHFYWGGAVMEIAPSSPQESHTSVVVRIDNPLFSKLQIDRIWSDGETGDLATVAVLDSGFASRCSDLVDALANGVPGGITNASHRMKNFVPGSTTMEDDQGHGSHCAGLIASRNIQHAVGIAPGCKLYVGKITDSLHNPSGDTMLKAIRWAAGLESDSPQDVDIISMSCGSLLNIPDMKPTIDLALSKGKILVFSIGNRDPESLPLGGNFPALFDNVVSVGSASFDNEFEAYSYQSPNLTIACPGTNVVSYWTGGNTRFETGTSQSAAICSGVIALLVSKLKKKGVGNIQKTVRDLLLTSSTKTTNGFVFRILEPMKLYDSINSLP